MNLPLFINFNTLKNLKSLFPWVSRLYILNPAWTKSGCHNNTKNEKIDILNLVEIKDDIFTGHIMKPLIDGILTGLFLQLALGPVFFYILGITIDSSYINGLCAIFAVTLADYIFIVLSLIGAGSFLQSDNRKTMFGLISSIILLLFGLMFFYKGLMFNNHITGEAGPMGWTPLKSFTSCFLLTISSPLTIVFWGSIFSAKAIEKQYVKKQLVIFGAGAGASTFFFLSSTMMILSSFKSAIPDQMVQVLNAVVGVFLMGYGIHRGFKIISRSSPC